MLDHFVNEVYEWAYCNTNQCNELKRLVKVVLEEDYVVVLQIYAVWWLS